MSLTTNCQWRYKSLETGHRCLKHQSWCNLALAKLFTRSTSNRLCKQEPWLLFSSSTNKLQSLTSQKFPMMNMMQQLRRTNANRVQRRDSRRRLVESATLARRREIRSASRLNCGNTGKAMQTRVTRKRWNKSMVLISPRSIPQAKSRKQASKVHGLLL